MIYKDCVNHYYDTDENYHLDMCTRHPEMIWGVDSFTCEGCTSYVPEYRMAPEEFPQVSSKLISPTYKTLRYEVKVFFADEKNLIHKKIFYSETSVLNYISELRKNNPLYDYSVYKIQKLSNLEEVNNGLT